MLSGSLHFVSLVLLAFCALCQLSLAGRANDRHGLCNDYGSKKTYMGKPYFIQDPEDGRITWQHWGMDFCASEGADVLAAASGRIVSIVWDNPVRGGSVVIRAALGDPGLSAGDSPVTIYVRVLHIDPERTLSLGDKVAAGTVVGKTQRGGKPQAGPKPHVHLDTGDCPTVWLCHTDPNQFWADGFGRITCFDEAVPTSLNRLVAPVRCK